MWKCCPSVTIHVLTGVITDCDALLIASGRFEAEALIMRLTIFSGVVTLDTLIPSSVQILNRKFRNRWTGHYAHYGPIAWPARSPDLTPLGLFLWGKLKGEVYQERPTTPENMVNSIINACASIPPETIERPSQATITHVTKRIATRGHHFEHIIT